MHALRFFPFVGVRDYHVLVFLFPLLCRRVVLISSVDLFKPNTVFTELANRSKFL